MRMRQVWPFLLFAAAMTTTSETRADLSLSSPAFGDGETIPTLYTCDGRDISPPLQWRGVPEEARSLALVVDDPDAPAGTWVHWVVYNIPPDTARLAEDTASEDLPAGAREGVNSWGRTGYGGPCPPSGEHRYLHKLYALDEVLSDLGNPTKVELERALMGHFIERARLIGIYER